IKSPLLIDPLSQETKFYNAFIAYRSARNTAALEQLDACIVENPLNIPAHSVKIFCLLKLGQYDEAINYCDKLPAAIVIPSEDIGSKALAFALNEDQIHAERMAKLLTELAQKEEGHTANSYLFLLAGSTGRNDDAFAWVELAMKLGSPLLLLRYSDPLV